MHEIDIEIPFGRIAALRQGDADAPKVMALHGWLDNAASFVPLSEHLHGIDLVAIDLPGHGRSTHLPPGSDYSFVGAMNAVLDVADALGWDRFALLGHSMGAGIASLIAAACPQRIERLLAIEALGALAETPERTVARMREALIAHRNLKDKKLRVFPDIDSAVRARQYASLFGAYSEQHASSRPTTVSCGRYLPAGRGTRDLIKKFTFRLAGGPLAGELLPPAHDHVDVLGVEFDQPRDTA